MHFRQMVRLDTLRMYDYGNAAANVLHYNQSTPPAYDLSKARQVREARILSYVT